MSVVYRKVVAFIKDESAPTMLEYSLLILVIALVVVTAAVSFGLTVSKFFYAGTVY